MYNFEHEMQKVFNDFSKQHNYFIIKKNIERDRRNLKNKNYFRCIRKNEIENTNTDKRKIVSKRIKCFFKIYDIFIENNKWKFEKIMNKTHNHENLNQNNYTKLRQYFMTEKIKIHIIELHRKDIASKKIFFSWKIR